MKAKMESTKLDSIRAKLWTHEPNISANMADISTRHDADPLPNLLSLALSKMSLYTSPRSSN